MIGRKHLIALMGVLLLGTLMVPAAQASQPRVIMAEDFGFAT